MYNSIAHHLLTNTQSDPCSSTRSGQFSFSPDLSFNMIPHGMGHPFGKSGSIVLTVSSPSSLYTPKYLAGRAAQGAEMSLCSQLLSTKS